jgi:hypothetical protein
MPPRREGRVERLEPGSARGVQVEPSSVPELLHHYTDLAGLGGIIAAKALWATDVRFMNDESEVRYSRKLLEEVLNEVSSGLTYPPAATVTHEVLSALAASPTALVTYAASFCEDGDNLSQWRGYGKRGAGYAIGFAREELFSVGNSQDYQLVRLIYSLDQQRAEVELRVREAIEVVAGWQAAPVLAPKPMEQLLSLGIATTFAMLSLKNPAFKDEREWRLAHVVIPGVSEARPKTRVTSGVRIPYEEVSLSPIPTVKNPIVEVVVGPTVGQAEDAVYVRTLLDRNGMADVSVRRSSVPLRRSP